VYSLSSSGETECSLERLAKLPRLGLVQSGLEGAAGLPVAAVAGLVCFHTYP